MSRGDGRRACVFLDAEGTLYLPREGCTFEDFWDGGEPSLRRAEAMFRLDPDAATVLRRLWGMGVRLVIASKHRASLLRSILIRFGVWHLFDDVLVGEDKAKMVTEYLERRRLPKECALMIGDSPRLDLYPLREAGIDALLLRREHNADVGGLPEVGSLREIPEHVRPNGDGPRTGPRSS